jgi:deferrochelatase/peroxidase EfeB
MSDETPNPEPAEAIGTAATSAGPDPSAGGDSSPDTGARPGGRTSRRGMLGGLVGGAVAAAGAGYGIARLTDGPSTAAPAAAGSDQIVSFYGPHQAGIATPAQDRLAFAAFDVTSTSATELQVMLGTWAAAAAQMAKGLQVGAVQSAPDSPPIDTGEAVGLTAANLTITVGFGTTLFDERFGLANRRPAALAPLPTLPGDGSLETARSGGDLCVQACADDPTVAFHAIRNFARLARGTAVIRWSQLGFGRTSSTSTSQQTERNLMGFKDGTRNIKAESASDMDDFVWVGGETDQAWMKGGSYLVARRIRMFIENWDRDYLADQQHVIGRVKGSGAPLSGGTEFTEPDFAAKDDQGDPVIPVGAHIRLASRESNGGIQILRRGYSFTDGIDPVRGTLLGGLFFIAFMKNPNRFVKLQTQLGTHDALNEYIQHTGSAVFACPPGITSDQHWGQSLFG